MKNNLKILIELLIKIFIPKLKINKWFLNYFKFNSCNKYRAYKKFLKLKTLIICIFIIVLYVILNNYLIMFMYFDKSSHSTISASKSNLWRKKLSNVPIMISSHSLLTSKLLFRNSSFDESNKNNNIEKKTYVDSLDLFITNMKNYDRNSNKDKNNNIARTNNTNINNDEIDYFDYNNYTKSNKNESVQRPCIHPNLNPFDNEILKFVIPEKNLTCNPRGNWVYVENGTLKISKDAIDKHGTIVCAYIPLYRGDDDFKVREGNRIFPVIDQMPLITDFFKVDCRSKDGAIYSNIHSGIAYDSSLKMRHLWNPLNKNALGFNVLMLGFDSVSRMSFIRMLPKTYDYIVKELGIVILKGYNIVGMSSVEIKYKLFLN